MFDYWKVIAGFLSIYLAGGHQKRFRLVESPHGWNHCTATSCHLFARYLSLAMQSVCFVRSVCLFFGVFR